MFNTTAPDSALAAPTQRTLSDYIADQLRKAILTDQFKPNQRLVEQEIAESMQTSRGPVRDALKILENEGLIHRTPHRGAFLAQITRKDAEEVYTLRIALEALALEFVVKTATDAQIEELAQMVQAMENLVAKDPGDQWGATALDLQFHRTLARISGHRRVLTAWESLATQIRLIVLKHRLYDPGDLRTRAVSWHWRIVDAIRQRNADLAVEELRRHLAISYQSILNTIEEKERSGELQAQ
jgi:DNA-binding GntR family transcriptional regulator